MTTTHSRDAYFDIGLVILADRGYAGLKLAEVCRRLGVTSGSFYHFFANWADFTSGLLEYWLRERTLQLVDALYAEPDPRARLRWIIRIGLELPHGAERAFRAWSHIDTRVHDVQAIVDQKRFEVVADAVEDISGDRHLAERFAHWSVYVLIGYEQTALPDDEEALHDIMIRLMNWLDPQVLGGEPGQSPAHLGGSATSEV